MNLRLSVTATDQDEERAHGAALELRRLLTEETDTSVALPDATPVHGAKGDPVTLGTLIVTFLTSGAAVSAFKVFQAFLTRKRSLEVKMERSDGRKFVLRAQDLGPKDIRATEDMFRAFFES